MVKNIICTSLGVFQLILEFLVFVLLFSSLLVKPFVVFCLCCRSGNLEPRPFTIKILSIISNKVTFYSSLFVFTLLVVLIYQLALANNLFALVYVYLYTIDVYIYNPLGIPSNPLNLPWGRFR